MGRNNREPKALMRLPDMALQEIGDIDRASWTIVFTGLRNREWTEKRLDELPELEEHETPERYTARIWDKLTMQEQAEAVALGVQRASWFQDALDLGIQLTIWRAWKAGLWSWDMEGTSTPRDGLRLWIDHIMSEERSPTEISQLTSTVLNLDWLERNEWIDEAEEQFKDPSRYTRWRNAASGLKNHIEAYTEAESEEELKDIRQDIMDLVEKIQDPGYTVRDIQHAARQKPRIPVLVFTVTQNGVWSASPTRLQAELLRARMGGDIEIKLEGEA